MSLSTLAIVSWNLLRKFSDSCYLHWEILIVLAVYLVVSSIAWFAARRFSKFNILLWVLFTAGSLIFIPFLTCSLDMVLLGLIYIISILHLILWLIGRKRKPKEEPKKEEKKEEPKKEEPKKEAVKKEEPKKEEKKEESEEDEEARQAKEKADKKAAADRLAALNAAEAQKAEEEKNRKRREELAAQRAQNEKDRQLYLAAMSLSAAPAPAFRLSREDVLDRMDEMAEDKYDYPVPANVRLRSSDRAPDSLRCGVWTFAVMSESKGGIIRFFARMDEGYYKELKKDHVSIEPSAFAGSNDWYKVIIDGTYFTKKEVFMMLDNWYAFVMNKYYRYDNVKKAYVTDEAAALQADSEAVTEAEIESKKKDAALEKAEKERADADALMLQNKTVNLNKKEMAKTAKAKFAAGVEVSERDDYTVTGLPLADTYYTPKGISDKGKAKRVCYAYVYSLTGGSVKVIAKLPKVYAERQAKVHTNMCRSKFPSGKSWYVTIIDSTYKSNDEVYEILNRSKAFVESTETRD